MKLWDCGQQLATGSIVAAVGFFLLVTPARASESGDHQGRKQAAKFLLICAGDQARTAPDFLAVVNFSQHSPSYGKVIATVPFPASDAAGNEPHHIGLSEDGKTVACGGLLSVLKGRRTSTSLMSPIQGLPNFSRPPIHRFPPLPTNFTRYLAAGIWSP